MYCSAIIFGEIFEKAQKELSFLRTLNFGQSSSNLAERLDKLCRSIIFLGPVSRTYGLAVIPDHCYLGLHGEKAQKGMSSFWEFTFSHRSLKFCRELLSLVDFIYF
jgi:hypothetical protein